MSIRRRANTSIVDIWVTNNSNDVNVIGSLRWAIAQAHNTLPTFIKVAPDFIDLAGVGRNMYVAGSWVTNSGGTGVVKDITIDFNYTNVLFGTGGSFVGGNNIVYPTFKLQNMVVENQDFSTTTTTLCLNMIDLTNCRFENLVSGAFYFQFIQTSTIVDCIFRNVVSTAANKLTFYYGAGTHIIKDCVFDNTIGVTGVSGAVVNFSRCYVNVADTFILSGWGVFTINFLRSYIRNSGTSTAIGLCSRSYGATITNCTFVNMRIILLTATGENGSNIRHCTQLYTLPITASTILNTLTPTTTSSHTIENNIFISPNSNNIFSTTLTNLTESNNLYLCVSPNAKFPNSTHYGASTPITTLIDTNEQGIGDTYKRYYLPTLTNNVARLADVLQNQIEQDRNNPTNIGAI